MDVDCKIIRKVHVLPKNSVALSFPAILSKKIHGVGTSEYSFSSCVLLEESSIIAKQKTSSSGFFWDYSISLIIEKQTNSIYSSLEHYSNKSVVLALELFDNRVFIYGSEAQPLNFLFSEINPKTSKGVLGIKMNFYGKCYHSPLISSSNVFYQNYLLPLDLALF